MENHEGSPASLLQCSLITKSSQSCHYELFELSSRVTRGSSAGMGNTANKIPAGSVFTRVLKWRKSCKGSQVLAGCSSCCWDTHTAVWQPGHQSQQRHHRGLPVTLEGSQTGTQHALPCPGERHAVLLTAYELLTRRPYDTALVDLGIYYLSCLAIVLVIN